MKIHTLSVGPFETNCFILESARHAWVVDPGSDPDAIAGQLEELSLTPSAYLLTHGHMDHVSALAALYERWPAPVAIHPDDECWAFSPANAMPPFFPVPRRPAEIANFIKDGQILSDHGMTCSVITTPGHTPGSVCFHFQDAGILLAGDTLFAGSVGRTDLPGGDSRTLMRSLMRLAALPDETRVLSGHGPETDITTEKQSNYYIQKAMASLSNHAS